MNPSDTYSEKLHSKAQSYLAFGWSVIPTIGKVAALAWMIFQQRRASLDQVQQWFSDGQFSALAIITGAISQLVVLDFDNPTLFKRFAQQFPHLMQTLTVQTRRGFHLYFHVPPNTAMKSLKLPGLDVQYEGRYVIASPSVVEGHEYITTRLQMPYTLTLADIAALFEFFNTVQVEKQATKITASIDTPRSDQPVSKISVRELIALYQQKASEGGRNHALFWVSILARDCGYSLEQTTAMLTDVHVMQNANGSHRRESPYKRKREAHTTIQSAYKRPPQPRRENSVFGQLPNVIREALLQQGATFAVRTLEMLRIKGILPGQTFTEKEAVALLTGIVGRESIRKTLGMLLGEGQRLIERVSSAYPPQMSNDIAFQKQGKTLSLNALRGVKKPDKIQKGRKARQFIMPDNLSLVERLGIKYRAVSDPLPQQALQSARQTRMTLHFRWIERKPGQYAMKFLAKRLGMTTRTIQNYHALLPEIKREAVFSSQPISWHTLNLIPDELPHGGFFLSDHKGKKYPAKIGIARRLLGEKKLQLTLNRQMPNVFWYGEGLKPAAVVAVQDRLDQQVEDKRQQQREWIAQKIRGRGEGDAPSSLPKAAQIKPLPGVQPALEKSSSGHVFSAPSPKKRCISGKRRLSNPDEEAAAQTVYQIINQMSLDQAGQVSLVQARKIVVRYGVYPTLNVLWRIQKREGVRKPIGLLCTILRSEYAFLSQKRKKV